MELEDLKENDYYCADYEDKSEWVLVKGINGGRPNIYKNNDKNILTFWNINHPSADRNIRLATKKEIYWLDECIKQDKFISFEEAMKSFEEPIIIYDNKPDPELNEILIKLLN